MSSDLHPLLQRCLGISISAGDRGIPSGEDVDAFINELTFRTCAHYWAKGACISLGHMWRAGGIMEHLARKACEFRPAVDSQEAGHRMVPLINRIAWPDAPPELSREQQEQFGAVVEIVQVGPKNVETPGLDLSTRKGKFARMRALTAMRQALVGVSHARICLGGAGTPPEPADDSGVDTDNTVRLVRLPGVIEEALLTWAAGQPLYLAGAFGGASRALCDAVLQQGLSAQAEQFFYTQPMAASLFAEFEAQHPVPAVEGPSLPGGAYDALEVFKNIPCVALAERSGLSLDDYVTLMTTPDVSHALELVDLGLGRLPPSGG